MNIAIQEYSRDTEHHPPKWVRVVCGWTVVMLVCHENDVRISARQSLAPTRHRQNTYLSREEFDACRRFARHILHPHPISPLHAPQHWMDVREAEEPDDDDAA